MWYFAWILGTAFACSFAVLYGLWFELRSEARPHGPAAYQRDPW